MADPEAANAFKAVVGADAVHERPPRPAGTAICGAVPTPTMTRTAAHGPPQPSRTRSFLAKLGLRGRPPGRRLTTARGRRCTARCRAPGRTRSPRSNRTGTSPCSRNPYFEQWSAAAQPEGYPDAHRAWTVLRRARQAAADVIAGARRTYAMNVLSPSGEQLGGQAPTLCDEFQVQHRLGQPERQAALQRPQGPAGAQLRGGPRTRIVEARSARQPLVPAAPASFPAWRPYCPYQTGPATEPYLGPDLARARELVGESGTAGIAITVRIREYPIYRGGIPGYIAEVLRGDRVPGRCHSDIPGQWGGSEDPLRHRPDLHAARLAGRLPLSLELLRPFSCDGAQLQRLLQPGRSRRWRPRRGACADRPDPLAGPLGQGRPHGHRRRRCDHPTDAHIGAVVVSPEGRNVLTGPAPADPRQVWVK